MDCSIPGFPLLHHLLELAQINVHWVGDATQTFHPLLSPSPPAFYLDPSIRVFSSESALASGGQSIGASASASVLPMNIQGWFPLGLTGFISLLSKGLSRVFSTSHFENINSLMPSLLYGPTLTSICDYWKNHSFGYTALNDFAF